MSCRVNWLCSPYSPMICLALLLGGCAAPKTATDTLTGQSLGEDTYVKPDEDPESVSSFTKFQRKTKYQSQKLFGLEPNESIARQHFAQGEKLFAEKKFTEAAKEYKNASKRWPDSPLQEDAMYMQGESYFFADKYTEASDSYGEMMKKYENSRYLEKAVGREFAIARYWDELNHAKHRYLLVPNLTDKTQPLFDTQGNALKVYESVHLNDPTGPLSDDAVMATANAHFLAGRYDDADYYYDLLRKEYPQSEHQQVAFVLGLRAKMRSYQGPHYEGSPIDEANELVHQIGTQFPDVPSDEKNRLREAGRTLRNQRAQRDWETAEYYAKTKHFGGARYYYNVILADYGDTPFAEMARSRLEQYKNHPDNPPDYFKWIRRAFNWHEGDT